MLKPSLIMRWMRPANCVGSSRLKPDVSSDVSKSKVEKLQLTTHGSLLLELRALQCNMSFSKAAMKDQLKQLAENKYLVAAFCR